MRSRREEREGRPEQEAAGGAPRAPDKRQAPPTSARARPAPPSPPDWLRAGGARSPLAAALGTARALGMVRGAGMRAPDRNIPALRKHQTPFLRSPSQFTKSQDCSRGGCLSPAALLGARRSQNGVSGHAF